MAKCLDRYQFWYFFFIYIYVGNATFLIWLTELLPEPVHCTGPFGGEELKVSVTVIIDECGIFPYILLYP